MGYDDFEIGEKVKVLGNTYYAKKIDLPQVEQGYGWVIRKYENIIVLGKEKDTNGYGDTFNYCDIEKFDNPIELGHLVSKEFKDFKVYENGICAFKYNMTYSNGVIVETEFKVQLDDLQLNADLAGLQAMFPVRGVLDMKVIQEPPKEMTLEEIEKELGYKIKLKE